MSIISICNSALIKLGQDPITTIDDNNKRAKICKEQYDKVRKELLSAHPWNFAIKRAELTTFSVPVYGFGLAYDLPVDCLRVLRTNDDDFTDYIIEAGKLLTNEPTMYIEYIADIADDTKYTATFTEVMSWALAYDLSYSLVGSRNFSDYIFGQYMNRRSLAQTFDAQEGRPYMGAPDEFTSARNYPNMSKYTSGWR